jgi:hypothetical protein
VHADEKLSAFVELEREVLTVTFYLESIRGGESPILQSTRLPLLIIPAFAQSVAGRPPFAVRQQRTDV